jgi:hypothetical protein
MKKLLLAAIVLASLSAAACKERRKDEPLPDYGGARSKSESSHKSLDKEAAGHGE